MLPLVDGTLDLLAVLVAAVPGVVGGPPKADFLLGVAFRLAKLVSPVPRVVSSPLPPLAVPSIVDVSRPSFWRCCFCHRLIESLSGACGRQRSSLVASDSQYFGKVDYESVHVEPVEKTCEALAKSA